MDGTEFVRRFLLHILPAGAAGAGGAGALAWTGLHRGASQPGAAMSFCLGLDQWTRLMDARRRSVQCCVLAPPRAPSTN